MSKSVPTTDDLNNAVDYALAKLCTEIPSSYAVQGLTEWDKESKSCKITQKGCQVSESNPLSVRAFDMNGEYITYDKHGNRAFAEFWDKYPPGFYAWRVTNKSQGASVCAPSNYLMQQWCESPKTRAEKSSPGITDTIPFNYNVRSGKEQCEIPEAYCRSKGVSYDTENKDCKVGNAQKVAEFFTGSVFIRSQNAKRAASDRRLKTNITLVREDFPVKGIHVYAYEWNDVALTVYGYSGAAVGFVADELDPKYVVEDAYGYKHIRLDYDDDTMRRMYAFLQFKNIFV